MKIQVFSDIHLEFGEIALSATDADVVVAAGDIGVGLSGIEWLTSSGKPTIYVAGNHEFYGGDLVHTGDAIAHETRDTDIHFLENRTVAIDGVRFIGATLWTDFMGGNKKFMAQAQETMNDYHQIARRSIPLQPQDLVEVNTASRAWLARELQDPYDGKTVVVTHHAPTLESWLYSERSFYRAAYCNDLHGLLERFSIDLWVHGHIHAALDYHAHDVHVVCNPRGYDGYQLVSDFDGAKTIDL